MKEAEVELEGVTWQPQISRMARALKRPGDEERWNYLARTAIHKNKVWPRLCIFTPGLSFIRQSLTIVWQDKLVKCLLEQPLSVAVCKNHLPCCSGHHPLKVAHPRANCRHSTPRLC